jgi:C-terminal processing protease CtpA/Prc
MTDELVRRVQDLVREHYVFADRADDVAAALDGIGPPEDPDPAARAAVLTAALQARSGDRHLRVRHYPEGVPPEEDEATVRAFWSEESRRTAGGVAAVRRLDAHTGLLEIGPVIPPLDGAAAYLSAAFTLLRGVDRLVVDLRGCVGGIPETVAFVVSHLTDGPSLHLQDVVGRDGSRESFRTTTEVEPLPAGVTVTVLTSARTFSGGEELAYDLQALGRARVVGEVSGGGAHPRRAFDLSDTLQVHVPVARSVNAVTGTNWEGVGVQPDVPCPADKALDVALELDAGVPDSGA